MPRIDSRDARALPPPDDAPPRTARGARRFDYAALLATRRTVARPVSDAPPASRQQNDPSDEADPSSGRAEPFPLISNERDAPASDPAPTPAELAECRAIAARIASAAAPIATLTLQEQRDHLGLLGVLSREIAAFCGDPAVAAGGQWEAHVVLSDRIVAATELHVSLSHFDLQLRFETQDREARQLLLAHSVALEQELDTMLRAWGQPRTVRLTVW
ncbi:MULTISPECIES: type III secretion system protein SctP [Burkholderia]|uniref:type III secretion system protein SctP n=1 Tax=Burkholderia TaxID=32008 RepID=UPI000B7AD65D|nr:MULTISPECIES: type III secretion system protein SctP [Burkholderia]OXI96261.1 type III secretion protein [Burkholderia sp. AU33803]PRD86314.1 type III secretion protein [Burkholderia contaminans]